MSTLITGDKLKTLVADGIIEHGSEERVEGIKYDFCLGGRFLKAKHRQPVDISQFGPGETGDISVEPGETVFVLSQEILHLPDDIKAELSHKRKLAHEGVQVLGGFSIDPGYEGRLIFGIYNFGSEPFVLQEGRKLIAAQFYRLAPDEVGKFPKPTPLYDFPDELIHIARSLRAISPQSLEEKINALTIRFETLRENFDKREDWWENFQKSVDELKAMIRSIGEDLDKEKVERQTGQGILQGLVEAHEGNLTRINQLTYRHRLIINVAIWILAAVVVILLTLYITNQLTPDNDTDQTSSTSCLVSNDAILA